MKNIILRNTQSPGDILMLTAAVRELHRCHPGQFRTDTRTSCPDLWRHNPHLSALRENARGVKVIDCHYPLIHRSNQAARHFLHGFIDYLNDLLGTRMELSAFRGDVHLSDSERRRPSVIHRRVGCDLPYWIIVAGGKYDFTIKWWHPQRYQQVVDHFQGRVQFVQVGERDHYHPRLHGAISLCGQTTLRQLIHLVHHAAGVLCPVTFLMHLAAAVETRRDRPGSRPCVVVAGGREPPHWEAYPNHQFIHRVGALPCCATGGCWRARTLPLGLSDDKDQPDKLCQNVVNNLPRCMHMITPDEVIRRMESYFEGGQARYLTLGESRRARPHQHPSQRELIRR